MYSSREDSEEKYTLHDFSISKSCRPKGKKGSKKEAPKLAVKEKAKETKEKEAKGSEGSESSDKSTPTRKSTRPRKSPATQIVTFSQVEPESSHKQKDKNKKDAEDEEKKGIPRLFIF